MIFGRALNTLSFVLRHHRGTYRTLHTSYLLGKEVRQTIRCWRTKAERLPNVQSRLPVQAISRGPLQHFFGYYDKCPWDHSGRRILGLEAPSIHRTPKPGDKI